MRFNFILTVTFLATIAAGLVIPANLDHKKNLADNRDEDDCTLFKREPKKSEARKARIAAAGVVRQNAKAARKNEFVDAAKAHRQTINLPSRDSTFHIPGDNHRGKPSCKFPRVRHSCL
jgi:hypothetical protein